MVSLTEKRAVGMSVKESLVDRHRRIPVDRVVVIMKMHRVPVAIISL
jgi:hypothetical protein